MVLIKVKLHRVMAERDIKTQKEFSKLSGIAPQSVSKIFQGDLKAIRFDTLTAICKALDCQPGDLLEYVPDGD